MRAQKFRFNQAKVLKIHYERLKEDDGKIKDTSYSKINPVRSHLNYNLHAGDMVELLEQAKTDSYVKCEKEAVAFYDFCVTYPKDCSVSSEDFFKTVYDIFQHDRRLKYCIAAYVHMDESRPHMHYICMPIEECEEFTKSKDVKVFDEKKGKEVTRRIKTTYTKKFNANKLFDKKLFNNLHGWLQKKINEHGITGTIITMERMDFNKWKQERIDYYNNLIEQNPDRRDEYVDAFWLEYQQMNPKKYKPDRPKDQRLDDFIEMTNQNKARMEELAVQKELIQHAEEDIEKEMAEYIEDVNAGGWTQDEYDKVANHAKLNKALEALEVLENIIKPLQRVVPSIYNMIKDIIVGVKVEISGVDILQNAMHKNHSR